MLALPLVRLSAMVNAPSRLSAAVFSFQMVLGLAPLLSLAQTALSFALSPLLILRTIPPPMVTLPPVDNSNTSQGTEDALNDLQGAASGATGTQVQPDATGPNGETTLKDIAKVVADSANAQIKATSEQNVATGKLVSNISKDIQNAIHNSGHGGGGASASLQAQGNGKLDTISDKLGEISDKLDDEKEETPFVPPADSAPFWENVLPDSAFTSIKDKKDSSIQELKDLQSEFSSGLFQTDLTVSGQRPEYDITFNGQNFSAGTFVFDLLLNSGLGAIIFLIATLTAIYIITTRSK